LTDTTEPESKAHDALLYLWLKLESLIQEHSNTYMSVKDDPSPEKQLTAERCLAIMHVLKNIAFHHGPMVEAVLGHKKQEQRAIMAAKLAGWVPGKDFHELAQKHIALAAEYQEIAQVVGTVFGLPAKEPVTLPQRIRDLKAAYYDKSDNLDAMQRGIRYGECVACHRRRAINHAGLCQAEVGLVEGVKLTDFKDHVPAEDLEGGS
jgi:hypothetical protein